MICHIFLELLRKKLRFAVLTRGDIEIPQTCWPCSSLFAVNSAPPLRIVDAQRNYLLLLIVFKPKFVFIRFRILNSFSLLPLTIIIFLWLSRRIFTIVPETYNVFRVYRVAALLYLQCMLYIKLFPTLNILYFYICASSSVCVCVCVQCEIRLFSRVRCLFTFQVHVARVLLKWFWHGFSRPYYWYQFWFYINMRSISVVRSSYFVNFSASFLITLL